MELGITLVLFALALGLAVLALTRIRALAQRLPEFARADQLPALLKPLDPAERLRAVDEQLRTVREEIARLPKPLAATDLDPLLERVHRLEAMVADVRIRVDEQRARTAYSTEEEGGLAGRVVRDLEKRGFERVRLLHDVEVESSAEELRIPVEARRGGMTFKGTATVADGRVTDVALRSATEIFP